MIKLENIKKIYKLKDGSEFTALHDIDIEFNRGEFVIVYGKSGSGKSTLLNILGGLDEISSGQFIINNESTENYKDLEWDYYRNKMVGFVFQSFNLISHLTVRENVRLALEISKTDSIDIDKKVEEILKRVGLEDHMDKKPGFMSGGQQQRVAIARALVNDPQIILADEPTGALDTETSEDIMNLLKEIAKDKIVIVVTHNKEMIQNFGTRILKLKDGSIEEDLIKQEVIKNDEQVIPLNVSKVTLSFSQRMKFTLNNIKSKWSRFFVSSLAFSIGIVVLLLILSLGEGLLKYYTEMDKQDNQIDIVPYYYTGGIKRSIKPSWLKQVDDLKNVDVRFISGECYSYFTYHDEERLIDNFGVLYKNADEFEVSEYIVEGRLPEEENEVLISSVALAGFYRIAKENSNSQKLINPNRQYDMEQVLEFYREELKDQTINVFIRYSGKTVPVKIVGITQGNMIPYQQYQENNPHNPFSKSDIVYTREFYDHNLMQIVNTDKMIVQFKNYSYLSLVFSDIDIGRIFDDENMPIHEFYKWQNINMIFNIVIISEVMLSLFGILILLGGAVTISIIVNMTVLEQRKNIGILRALGVRKKDIRRIFRAEGILSGLCGALLGIIFTLLLVTLVNTFTFKRISALLSVGDKSNDILILRYWMALPIILIGILFGIIGANKPAKAATKINPIEALQSGAEL